MAKLVKISIQMIREDYHATIITEENGRRDFHFLTWKIGFIGGYTAIVDTIGQEELTKVVSIMKTKKDKETIINMYQKPLKDARRSYEKKLTKKNFNGWKVEKYEEVEF